MTKEIRQDLQIIRGFAIISVVGFHFYPETFPNGYLGVDQFFVLSGYLMCMLLQNSIQNPWYTFIGFFYFRRLKRILPLYFLTIFGTLLAIFSTLTIYEIDENLPSAKQALVFMSNMPRNQSAEQMGYFQKLISSADFFTHTWSLSVEVQYYFMVPFLFLFTKPVSLKSRIAIFLVIGLLSSIHFIFSGGYTAFNSVFSRTWQFVMGMIVYLKSLEEKENSEIFEREKVNLLEDSEDSEKKIVPKNQGYLKKYSNLILFITVAITMYGTPFSAAQVRFPVTLLTSLYIYASSKSSLIIDNFLVYTGNISFSLYLIHWPIYEFWKCQTEGFSEYEKQLALLAALLFSIILSVFVHETFEKWSLKIHWKHLTLLVTVLAALNFMTLQKTGISKFVNILDSSERSFPSVHISLINKTFSSYDDVEAQNQEWHLADDLNLRNPATGTWRDVVTHRMLLKNHTGENKFLIMGSSSAARLAHLIQDECGFLANEMIQLTFAGCEIFYPSTTPHLTGCTQNLTSYETMVRREKPDYLVLASRYFSMGDPMATNISDIEYDPVLAVARNQLRKYMKDVKKKIIILHAFPAPFRWQLTRITEWIAKGWSGERIDKKIVIPLDSGFNMARQRYEILLKECGPKCRFIDYYSIFLNPKTNFVRYFNHIGLSYFTSTVHLTPLGFEIVRPYVRDVCKTLE